MQVSTDALESHNPEGLKGCVCQMYIKNNRARSNACWRCGDIGHLHKDCTTTLPSQNSDKKGRSPDDTSPTTGEMSHILTASTQITDFTFKVILNELISSQLVIEKQPFAQEHEWH